MALTTQKIKFAEIYIQLGGEGHGAEAAEKAGYSAKSAASQASRLLKDAEISAYIRGRMRAMRADVVAQTDEIMRFFTEVMRGNVKDQFDLDPQLADRIKAGVELMKRYTCMEEREIAGMEREAKARESSGGVVFCFEKEGGGDG